MYFFGYVVKSLFFNDNDHTLYRLKLNSTLFNAGFKAIIESRIRSYLKKLLKSFSILELNQIL